MASTTPRFDDICTQFRSRINDVAAFDGSGNLLDGNIITASGTVAYVNRAMDMLINNTWNQFQGDPEKVIKVFPELIVVASGITFSPPGYGGQGTVYIVNASPYLDYTVVIPGTTIVGGTLLSERHISDIAVIATSFNLELTPSATNKFLIVDDKNLYVFPTNGGGAWTGCTFQYVKAPTVSPSTGSRITQNGGYDSPYRYMWNMQIAELAVSLYYKDVIEVQS